MRSLKRPKLFGHSLSARVLWFTVAIIMLVEIAILLPSLGRERQAWLWQHVTEAHLAAYSIAMTGNSMLNPATRAMLLKLTDASSIVLIEPNHTIFLQAPGSGAPGAKIALDSETLAESVGQACLTLIGVGASRLEVLARSPLDNDASLDIVLNGDDLATYLQNYVEHIVWFSVIIALFTGLLVFAALDRMLVRPMRIITASIVNFRQDPEHALQSGLGRLAQRGDHEISRAAGELKMMQDELRAALWRNARLAAVGTAVAKISHDLRNILSSALLVADRLQETADPVAKRAARTLIPAVERAAELVSRTVDFAREGPPALTRGAVKLHELVEEAALVIRASEAEVAIDNLVPEDLVLALDRAQIYRVLVNLMRNAVEAGADLLMITVDFTGGITRLKLRDNGPGLPLRVQDNLFKPFTGSGRRGGTGLGLAIARDLIRAHGGDLLLLETGPRGTIFVMDLATSELQM